MKILFVGSYLRKQTETLQASETISKLLFSLGNEVILKSTFKNKILRLLDIIYFIIFKKYDLVFIDVFSGKGFYIAFFSSILLKILNKKYVLILHGGNLHNFYNKNHNKIKLIFSNSLSIISPSQFLINFFKRKSFNIEYIPNSINLDKFKYKRKKKISYTLLWVRAFNEIYNPELLIKSIAIVKEKIPNIKLKMIGPDKGNLKHCIDLVKKYNLKNNIDFLGPISNNKLPQYFYQSDLFINTTKYESFGVSLIESAACGTPIISNPVGEIPIIWNDNRNIIFFKKSNSNSLAKKIFFSLNSFNRNFMNDISQNALINIKKFSRKQVLKKWKVFLKKIKYD